MGARHHIHQPQFYISKTNVIHGHFIESVYFMILCIFEHVIYFFTIIFVSEHTEHLYFNVESLRVSMFVNKETTYLLTY